MTAPVLYYVCHVSRSGRVSLRWSRGYDRQAEAQAEAVRLVRAGQASMAVVVEFRGRQRTPLESSVKPESARKVVRHWLDIWDACESPPPA